MQALIKQYSSNTIGFILLILFLCCMLIVEINDVGAAANAITLDEYWEEVESTINLVQELQRANQIGLNALENKANYWEEVSIVTISENEYVTIDTSFLVSLLREDPPNLDYLETHLLMQLETYKDRNTSSVSPNAEKILTNILEQEEFQWKAPEQNRVQQFFDELLQNINKFLSGLFDGVSLNINFNFRVILYIIGAIFLMGVFYYVFSHMREGLIADVELLENGEEAEYITSEIASIRAQESFLTGDTRNATRYLYLSILLFLEDKKILRYDRSKTNREYMMNVAEYPELIPDFARIVDTFDQVWYGFQVIDEEAFRLYQEQIRLMREKI